jgi:uncharacterized protein (TIGR02117 family)
VIVALTLAVGLSTHAFAGGERVVYLVSHGWHVGLVLERQALEDAAQPGHAPLGDFRYVEIGWGDGDYYPAPRGTLRLALRAAFSSRWSLLQVVGFDAPVTEMFPESRIFELTLSPQGVAALARYIDAAFLLDGEGKRITVGPPQYGSGAFYLAHGRYRLADNSNTWAARALAIAGCPIDADAVMTAGTLLRQAARFAEPTCHAKQQRTR